MPRTEHPSADDLASERAANRQYLTALQAKSEARIEVVGPANTTAFASLRLPVRRSAWGPLVGRLGLATDDPASSIYIGPRFHDDGNLLVISWATPAAQLFFQGGAAVHPLAEKLVAIRTFTSHADEIVRIDEDRIRAVSGGSPFSPPEGGPTRLSRTRGAQSSAPNEQETPSRYNLRAEGAVREALAARRSGHLQDVLSTLQADQYRAVSHPDDQCLIVEGHPGTGKTVIAAHRAGYLVHPDRPGPKPKRVLLLGPNSAWADHVKPLVGNLIPDADSSLRLHVMGLSALLADTAGLPAPPHGSPDGLSPEEEERLIGLAAVSARVLATRHGWNPSAGSRSAKVRAIYEEIVASGADVARSLRPWEKAIGDRRMLPILAGCAVALLAPVPTLRSYDHIIVDEAQDLTRTEWCIARALNRRSAWTIVGDMHQRRTDGSHTTWESVLANIGDPPFHREHLRQGFRSTQQILDFAGRLLPTSEPKRHSIQTGAEVIVERADTPSELLDLAMHHVERLSHEYSGGSVAIYTERASDFIRPLRDTGWQQSDPDRSVRWNRTAQRLSLHTPISGRGIEFDAVVIVEPSDYPGGLHESGPLYTSLTRANRELAVVHCLPLPPELGPGQTPRAPQPGGI